MMVMKPLYSVLLSIFFMQLTAMQKEVIALDFKDLFVKANKLALFLDNDNEMLRTNAAKKLNELFCLAEQNAINGEHILDLHEMLLLGTAARSADVDRLRKSRIIGLLISDRNTQPLIKYDMNRFASKFDPQNAVIYQDNMAQIARVILQENHISVPSMLALKNYAKFLFRQNQKEHASVYMNAAAKVCIKLIKKHLIKAILCNDYTVKMKNLVQAQSILDQYLYVKGDNPPTITLCEDGLEGRELEGFLKINSLEQQLEFLGIYVAERFVDGYRQSIGKVSEKFFFNLENIIEALLFQESKYPVGKYSYWLSKALFFEYKVRRIPHTTETENVDIIYDHYSKIIEYYKKAAEWLEFEIKNTKNKKESMQLHHRLRKANHAIGEYLTGIYAFEEALAYFAKSSALIESQLFISFINFKQANLSKALELARTAYQKARAVKSTNPDAYYDAMALYAICLQNCNQWGPEAQKLFKEINDRELGGVLRPIRYLVQEQVEKELIIAKSLSAIINHDTCLFQEQKKILQKYIDAGTKDGCIEGLYAMFTLYEGSENNVLAAEPYFKKALAKDRGIQRHNNLYAILSCNYTLLLLSLNKNKEAERIIQRAIASCPQSTEFDSLLEARAAAYALNNKLDKAKADLSRLKKKYGISNPRFLIADVIRVFIALREGVPTKDIIPMINFDKVEPTALINAASIEQLKTVASYIVNEAVVRNSDYNHYVQRLDDLASQTIDLVIAKRAQSSQAYHLLERGNVAQALALSEKIGEQIFDVDKATYFDILLLQAKIMHNYSNHSALANVNCQKKTSTILKKVLTELPVGERYKQFLYEAQTIRVLQDGINDPTEISDVLRLLRGQTRYPFGSVVASLKLSYDALDQGNFDQAKHYFSSVAQSPFVAERDYAQGLRNVLDSK